MSCSPGTPCYNTQTIYSGCADDPCNPNSRISCDGVVYSGPNLICTGIEACDTLCTALQKIDDAICTSPGSSITANNGLLKTLNNIQLGGPLVQNTSIGTNPTNTLSITGLVVDSNPDYILTETSLGVVRRALPSSISNNITLNDNVGLEFSAPNELSTIYNTLVPDDVTSIQVGGAAPALASFWKTKTLVEVLDLILFPLQLPTYANPTIGFGTVPSGLQEIGKSITVLLTPSATKNAAGAFTQFRIFKKINTGLFNQLGSNITAITPSAGPVLPTQFGFADLNNPNFIYTATSAYSDIFAMPAPSSGTSSSIQYKVDGNYNAGVAIKDSLGNLDTRTPQVRNSPQVGPQAASTGFESSVQTITGIYPYFWGKSSSVPTPASIAAAIAAGTANKVLASADGTLSITFASTSEYIWFVHYSLYTRKKSWNTSANPTVAAIGVDLDPSSIWTTPVTQNVTSPDGYWSSVPFSVYISRSQQTSAAGIVWDLRNNPV
jgi:hypothetical protein